MSTTNFDNVREWNFQICHKRRWSMEEKSSHINLYDENHKLVNKFHGHIALSEFLNKE